MAAEPRPGMSVDPGQRHETPVEVGARLNPELAQYIEVLRHPCPALGQSDTERGELVGNVSETDADDESSPRDLVDRGELLRQPHRVMLREDQDAGCKSD